MVHAPLTETVPKELSRSPPIRLFWVASRHYAEWLIVRLVPDWIVLHASPEDRYCGTRYAFIELPRFSVQVTTLYRFRKRVVLNSRDEQPFQVVGNAAARMREARAEGAGVLSHRVPIEFLSLFADVSIGS